MINKIFIVFFGILFISSVQVWSKDYYISNSGSDSNNGFTEQTAWKTLEKLNKEMSGFKAGDNIYFQKGSTFYGTLKIHYLKGSSAARISFKSYGTGNNPIITNGKLIENWTRFSGNIYEAKVPETVYQVFKNNKSLMNGRTDLSSNHTISKIGSQQVLFSEDLLGMNKLEGATIVLKVRSWYMSNRTVTKFDSGSGRVEINQAPNYDMREGNEFFINNHINLLDKQDEWSYNKSEQKLYIYSLSSPIGVIAAASDNNGVEIFNCSYVQINDIDINFVNNAGIYINKSNNINVEKNTISYAYHSGIITENGSNILIKNNSINNSVVHGIYNYTDYSILESNYISNTGMVKNMTYKQSGQSYGIKLKGSNNIVRNNNITDTGYIGIRFYHENGVIENNLIENFCMELSDGGGIYTFNTNFGDLGGSGTIVKNNIILGSANANKHNIVVGLYADDRAHDVVFQGNSIANVDRGVFLHNTKKIEVLNNNIYRATDTGIGLGEDFQNGEMVYNVITGNSVFMEETELYKYALKIKSKWDNYKMAAFDNNKYFNPYSFKHIGIRNTSNYWLNSGNPKSFSLKEWQNKSKEDLKSEENSFQWDDHVLEEVIGNNLVVNGDFESNVSDWGSPGTDLSLKEESGQKFLNVHPTKNGGASLSNTFQVKSNTEYLFEFDIKSDSDITLRLDVARTSSPYNGFMVRPIWVSQKWQHYSIKIDSDISASDMRINFYSSDGLTDFQLDNVEFKEVNLGPPPERSYFAYNKETVAQSVNIPTGVWEDLDGNVYSGGVTLKPFTSKILILTDKSVSVINADAGKDVDICKGESSILNATGGSSYQWSNGATTQSITVTPNNTTTYSVTVSENGESDTDEVIVTVNEVVANAGADRMINEGDVVSLTATGGDTYLWSTGATTETISVSPNETVTYTVTSTIGSCDDTDEVKVTVSPSTGGSNPVSANAGLDESICKGESTTLTASGGSTYSWNTGATSQSIIVNPTSTQTYIVTVTDTNGNSDSDEVLVTVNTVAADAGSDVTIDEGNSVTLKATGGESYLWNTGATTQSITVKPTSTRSYSVTVSENGCSSTDEVIVTVIPNDISNPPLADADAGEDVTICLGESVLLTGSGGESYLWNTGETSNTIEVSPSRTATYELSATRGGVTNSDFVTVTVENCSSGIIDEESLIGLELKVFPNPTEGLFQIHVNNMVEDSNIQINDMKGSIIHSDMLMQQNLKIIRNIDLTRFADGIYFVTLSNSSQILVKKLIIL